MSISKPRILISHSFGAGSDDTFAAGLRRYLQLHGFDVTPRNPLDGRLSYKDAWDEDITDLWKSFRKADLDPTWQEHSDPRLQDLLLETLASKDLVISLWSKDYANKFWSRFEWKTALVLAKPLILINLDGHPLAYELNEGARNNLLNVIPFGPGYQVKEVVESIKATLLRFQSATPRLLGEVTCSETNIEFIRVSHPMIGEFEISKKLVSYDMLADVIDAKELAPDRGSTDESPLTVSWDRAVMLCSLISHKTLIFRLPSDIEWEFAARAGETSVSGIAEKTGRALRDVSKALVANAWGIEFPVDARRCCEWCGDEVKLFNYNGWINPVQPNFVDGKRVPTRSIRYYNHLSLGWSSMSKSGQMPADQRAASFRLVRTNHSEHPRSVELSFHTKFGVGVSPNAMNSNVRSLLQLSTNGQDYYDLLVKMGQQGELNSELRQYLEECIDDRRHTRYQKEMLEALLQDIKDAAFVPPMMPSYLKTFYDEVVSTIEFCLIGADSQTSAQFQLDLAKSEIHKLNETGLLTSPFMELLRRGLRTNVSPVKGESVAYEVWKEGIACLADLKMTESDWDSN